MRRFSLPMLLTLSLLWACAGGPAPGTTPPPQTDAASAKEEAAIRSAISRIKQEPGSDYRISPTDLVSISVFQQPDLKRKLRITQNGTVSLPLVGNMAIGGLTVTEATARIAEKYREFIIDPQVTIFIDEYAERKIYVLGEVKSPGSFDLPVESRLTVLEAITLAGGFTPIAAPDRTKVVRMRDGQNESIKIEVSAITKRGEKDKDIPLEPNDVVHVPQSYF